jgi:ABC-type dipeptide/oligopeptide/nickel transport system permease component
MKNIQTILIESVIIGIVFLVVYKLVDFVAKHLDTLIKLFISAALVHVVFEYTGLNKMYVDAYYK